MNNPTFTGKRRHRTLTRRYRKPLLVLQLEVEGYVTQCDGGVITGTDETWWIDAQVEHITDEAISADSNLSSKEKLILEEEIARLKEERICEYKHIKSDANPRLYSITCNPNELSYFPVGWIQTYCAFCGGKIESK